MSTGPNASQRRDGEDAIQALLLKHRDEILNSAYRHGAQNVRVFGSVARGESTSNSDIDFLVDASDTTSAWFPAGLVQELERLLARRVDVITEQSLHWLLRRRILKEAKLL
jgi:predicted nucleotidyltransferase